MTDDTNTENKKTLKLGKGKLGLKTPVDTMSGGSHVRQNLNNGRSKGVMVEVRKKRIIMPDGASQTNTEDAVTISSEQAHRLRVLQDAKEKAAEEARIRSEEEAKHKAEEEAKRQAAEEEAKKQALIDSLDKQAEEKEKAPTGGVSAKETVVTAKTSIKTQPAVKAEKKEEKKSEDKADVKKKFVSRYDDDDRDDKYVKSSKIGDRDGDNAGKRKNSGNDERRNFGKNVLKNILKGGFDDDDDDRGYRSRSLSSIKRSREKEKNKLQESRPQEKVIKEVVIPDTITVQELSNRMAEKAASVIKILMKLGMMVTINQTIDADTAQIVVEEMGHKFRRVSDADIEFDVKHDDKAEDLIVRPPVVTVMGHVDHGKTSLLDALRKTNVVSREAGGITQHIGAYQVALPSGEKVTFIDTPGHAAFSSMRARGAKVTDIVILVVAANDGVMPQTIEAIKHAKAAEVPIVVAINKIDVPGADPQKVKTELLQYGVVAEDMGGDAQMVEVSAKKHVNLDKLVEAVLLQAEVLELKANPNRSAEGVVIESKMEKGRGPVATILVNKGTLKVGDYFVAGKEWGRVRALMNEFGQKVDDAAPSVPVEVLGLDAIPQAGDELVVVDSENKAREISLYRHRKERESLQVKSAKSAMDQIFDKIKAGEIKELPIVIKADVQGSVEALVGTLEKIKTDKVKVKILHSAVGPINESDITLAHASNAMVIGFNVRASGQARDMAKRDGVEIRYYSIIYDVANDTKQALEGMMAPEIKEKMIGYASVKQVFNITKVGKVAGCMVTEGVVKRGAQVRLLRDNVVLHTGALSQLKRFKDDAREVRENMECGMSFENYSDIQVGDVIECFEIEEVKAKLELGDGF